MSDPQAIETEIEIETGEPEAKAEGFTIEPDEVEASAEPEAEGLEIEAVETEEEAETDGPIEIEVAEGEKPAPRRLSRTTKRIMKEKEEAASARAEAEALREENKLLRMAQQQKNLEPDEDTFEGTEEEFKAAQRAFNQAEIKRIAHEEAQQLVQQTIQHTTQQNIEVEQDSVVDAHYERGEKLVTNFNELEGSTVDVLGEDFTKAIILSDDNSHRIIASLGANPREAAKIAQLAKSNPTKAFALALKFPIHPSLAPASLNTLDPEKQVDPGRGVSQGDPALAGVKFE